MAAPQGLGLGFAEAKIERRRPSKRKTTLRTFSIVRNWECKQVEPVQNDVQTPVKEGAKEKELVHSPVFPTPSSPRHSLEVPSTLTSDSDDAKNSLTETTSNVSLQPVEESKEHSDTNQTPGTSVIVDEADDEATPQSFTVPPTPENHHVQGALQVPLAVCPPEPTPDYQVEDTDTLASAMNPASTSIPSQSPRVTRGRKRKKDKVLSEEMMQEKDDVIDDEDDDDTKYSGNSFVRIFNADQGRKVTMGEITVLDVALTAIEELALEYREKVDGDVARQSIKEFFILIRKSFCECIDTQKDFQTLKSDCRKVNSRVKKLRGELLDVQKKRARIRGELEKYEKEERESEKNNKDVLDISEYLHHMDSLNKSCKMISKETDYQDNCLPSNLPNLLCQTHAKLNSLSKLKSINGCLQKLLCT